MTKPAPRRSRRKGRLLKSVGAALRANRVSSGLTPKEFAYAAGCERTHMYEHERGIRELKIGTLDNLARAMGRRASDILRDAEWLMGEVT